MGLIFVQMEETCRGIAGSKSQNVVQKNRRNGNCDYGDPVFREAAAVGTDTGADDQQYADRRNKHEDFFVWINSVSDDMVYKQPQYDRKKYDKGNRKKHVCEADLDPLACEQEYKPGGEDRCEQGTAHDDGNGERNVALCEKCHNIGRGSPGHAAEQNNADRKLRTELRSADPDQLQKFRDKKTKSCHEDVLAADAEQNLTRTFQDQGEVFCLQGDAHAEHDDPEQDIDKPERRKMFSYKWHGRKIDADVACKPDPDRRDEKCKDRDDHGKYSQIFVESVSDASKKFHMIVYLPFDRPKPLFILLSVETKIKMKKWK